MPQSWRWKVYLTLFTALLSLYALIPTWGGFSATRETAEKKGEGVPWYVKWFPNTELNLGLDLRGGIYLELDVTVDDAIRNRLDLMAGDIARDLKNAKIEGAEIARIDKTLRIRALLPDAAGIKTLQKTVDDYFRGALLEERGDVELVYQSDEKDENRLQALYAELAGALAEKSKQVSVERNANSDLFRVELLKGDEAGPVRSLVAARFPALKEIQEPHKIIYTLSQAYLDKFRKDTVKQAVETIRNRIDRYGVAEPSIRQLGETRVAVELPGVTDPDRAIGIVKKGGKLEFKLVDDSKNPQEVKALVGEIRQEKKVPEGFTEEIVNQLNDAAKGKIPSDDEILFEIQHDPLTKKIVGGTPYLLKRKAEITGDMLSDAKVGVGDKGPYVSLSFNAAGTRAFAELTAANVKRQLAIILDGNVNSAPVINEPIPSGQAQITFGKGYEAALKEAEDLVLILREGALPASLKEVTKTVIGPTLGKSAIHKGLLAALIAGITVVLFMILYYKGSGVIADLALGLNVLLIMGILALFQATLTLPGIAGIVLTMGMALDANVIIFERIREELKLGKPVRTAVEAGFHNALSAVVDTHLTTFLSGIVLYNFGTGPIRGFAVTLMIGVATTLFTAYWVSHLVYEFLLIKLKIRKVSI